MDEDSLSAEFALWLRCCADVNTGAARSVSAWDETLAETLRETGASLRALAERVEEGGA